MSKLAKKPITIPSGVTATIDGGFVSVKGPKGELRVRIPEGVELSSGEGGFMVKTVSSAKQARANTGTVWSLVRNAAVGVSEGYAKILEVEGVGYKFAVEGTTVVLSLGYVNPVKLPIPKGVAVAIEKNTMTITGADKEVVGQFAAVVRAQKKPEPYKGKGIHYRGEVIKRKAGKKATTTSG